MTDMWREAEAYAEFMGEGLYDEPPADDEAVRVPTAPEPPRADLPEEDCPF